jgi:AraC family transcriptional activator of tynA and feaB
MLQLFSTELLPASDRIDAWQWNAQQICGDCRIELPRASFHGSIEMRQLGALRLTRFSSSPLSFWKWPLDIASPDRRLCIVITQLAGVRRYAQNGTEVLLQAGDSTVIDAGRPWSSTCQTECVRLYLRAPRWLMEERLQSQEIPIAQKISGTSRLGATLSRVSESLYDEASSMQEDESVAALDAYFQILAACIGFGAGELEGGAQLLSAIRRYIDAHLADPSLTPNQIALAMEISLRHLHRVFSATGSTMGDYVRARRLEQCRKDMLNPQLRRKTITEIAFCWGFSDAAHFSHSFRKRFGVSAREYRAAQLQTAGSDAQLEKRLSQPTSPVQYAN